MRVVPLVVVALGLPGAGDAGSDAPSDAPDAGRDGGAPSCGTIYCFAGCSCADPSRSACTCP